MLKRVIVAVAVAVAVLAALAGCASPDMYRQYAEGQAKIEVAKYTAQAEKYKAIAQIAGTGDSTAKVAAVVAMAMGDMGGGGGGGTGGSARLSFKLQRIHQILQFSGHQYWFQLQFKVSASKLTVT